MESDAKTTGILLRWNPNAKPSPTWGVALFHDAGWNCIRDKSKTETGAAPPLKFYPCSHCFPYGSRKRSRVVQQTRDCES